MKRLLIAVLLLNLPVALYGQQSAPELSLSVNGKQSINLYSGWPLIVHITIMNSSRFGGSGGAAPLVIAPNGASWTDAIQVTAVSSSGTSSQWPLKLVGTPDSPSLTLPPTSYIRAFWQMSPGDASAIHPDTYQLTATLQVANSNGWNGVVQSRPATVQVGPEPTLPAELQSQKAILLAEYATNAGDLETALSGLQQLIQSQPKNTLAMSAAANVLELRGYPGMAYLQVSSAVDAYYAASPSLTEPPANMLTILKRSLETMLAANAAETPTATSVSAPTAVFSTASQTITLSAMVTASANGPVQGGTVTFVVSGVGNPVTSSPVSQGTASVSLVVPAATPAGRYPIQATYGGTASFAASVDSADALTISKATPVITWNDPGPIASGTPLGAVQLNATASIPGAFVYNPPAGTVMTGSSTQTLNVTFTPADSTDYFSAIATVMITITPPPCASNLTASVAVTRSGFSYSPLLKRYAQTLTLTNTSGSTITGPIYVILDNLSTGAALYNAGGSTACAAPTGSPYISIAGPIGAGASTNVVLQFSDPTNAAITYTARFLAGTGQP
jgi:hypothetical protein